jgi:hypothetical protein
MSGRRTAVLGLVVLLAAAAVVGARLLARRGGGVAALAPAEAAEIARTRNVALGALENQQLDRAVPALEALARLLPRDPLPLRNLAVARVVALGDTLQAIPDESLLPPAKDALDALRRGEGESEAWHWLQARYDLARGAPAAAADHYEALAAGSGGAAAWYALARARRDADATAAADTALDRAAALAPGNVWLAVEWFRAAAARLQADRGSARPDPALADAIAARRGAIAPFAPSILTFTRVDVGNLLDEAAAAARTGDAAVAAGRLRALANVLVPQSEGDRRDLERHPLVFVRDTFATPLPDAPGQGDEPIAVALQPLPPPGEAVGVAPTAVVLDDIDLDGRLDLVAAGPAGLRVATRDAQGAWQPALSAALPDGAAGVITADLDLDFDEARRAAAALRPATDPAGTPRDPLPGCPAADLDLVAFGRFGLLPFRNRIGADGARSLEPLAAVTTAAVAAATVADLDADGDLDLVSAGGDGLRMWSNDGLGTFRDVTPPALDGSPAGSFADGAALLVVDADRDVDVDVVVVTPAATTLLENLRHGQFRAVPVSNAGGSAVECLDPRAAGRWDLVIGGADGIRTVPARAGGGAAGAAVAIDGKPRRGLLACDLDNDGRLDLVGWGDDGLVVLRGTAAGGFEERALGAAEIGPAHAVDAGDVDGDGDLDLAVAAANGVLLLENQGGNAHHWLDVALEAQQVKGDQFSPSGRVNAHGVGGLLELKAGSAYQPRAVRRRTTHFGLGTRRAADVVRVLWLNGVPQNLIEPPADTLICEQQVLLGSCPYLYAWNGSGFAFVTDLLWGAPLGLQRAAGQLMPAREWEHLLVPGGALVPRDGRYVLQLTEELWEAAYFDEVRLVVVDHPADVEVVSNEKVGPAAIAAFGVHTLARPRHPVAARDDAGRDLLPALARADGTFARPTARKLRQGLLETHHVELDLGPDLDRDRLVLFLSGWTYPTTVNLNVQLTDHPVLDPPRPPFLEVPDGQGGWREALRFIGFPGGKTKSIAVDIAGVLPPGESRLRIGTSMEIRWDEIRFTTGEAPAPTRVVELEPLSADLHRRGCSRIERDGGDGPERFPYDDPVTTPKWPPMDGCFTALGDVRDLLAASDDRLVVMGEGDEVTLEFAVPPPPPPGWTRDFLFKSVGWDKDANLATAAGQAVEPLPFRSMRSYPPGPDDPPPDSAASRSWLRDRQTRRQTGAFWRAVRDGTVSTPGGG